MGNRLKEFLFPSKDKNEFETTTVELSRKELNSNPTITSFNAATDNSSLSSPSILTPKSFMEVETVAMELLNHRAVIVDLTATNIDEAKRICDFLNGVTYAINGQVKKVAKLVYMFTPQEN